MCDILHKVWISQCSVDSCEKKFRIEHWARIELHLASEFFSLVRPTWVIFYPYSKIWKNLQGSVVSFLAPEDEWYIRKIESYNSTAFVRHAAYLQAVENYQKCVLYLQIFHYGSRMTQVDSTRVKNGLRNKFSRVLYSELTHKMGSSFIKDTLLLSPW